MHQMLRQGSDSIEHYVIGTGRTHTAHECARHAFDEVGLDYDDYIIVDDRFLHPAEVNVLHAGPARAENELGWSPSISFEEMIREVVQTDLTRIREENKYWIPQSPDLRSQFAVLSDKDG